MPIRKDTPVPLYYQLAEQIREQIESQELVPGSQLPSERDLADRYGISRMTARQALTYLVRQGRLIVRPGIGTFVAEPKLTHNTLHLLGFTEEMLAHGQAPSSRVLEQALVEPPQAVAARLGLRDGERATRIVRLRLSQDVPLLLETVYVAQRLAPGLEQVDLAATSLYAALEERFGLHLHHASQTMELTTARADEATLLDVPAGASLLLLDGVTYTEDDRPVEAFKALYRGDKFSFTVESRRHHSADRSDGNRLSVVLKER